MSCTEGKTIGRPKANEIKRSSRAIPHPAQMVEFFWFIEAEWICAHNVMCLGGGEKLGDKAAVDNRVVIEQQNKICPLLEGIFYPHIIAAGITEVFICLKKDRLRKVF